MTKGRVIAAVAGLVVVAGVAAGVALGVRAGAEEVLVEEARRGTVAVTVAASGKVEADDKVDVYPPTAGTIATLAVDDGDLVKAGDIIATLDTEPLELQLAQAEAAYAAAVAQLDLVGKQTPSAADRQAMDAQVAAAWSTYQAALEGVAAAQVAKPSQAQVDLAQDQADTAYALYEAAQQAYDDFKEYYDANYAGATPDEQVALDVHLAALDLLRDQAYSSYMQAQAGVDALLAQIAAADAAVAQAEAGRDQAYAAYLLAKGQQTQLLLAGDVSAQRAAAEAAIDQAAKAVAMAEANLEGATMIAPIDGTVVFSSASFSGGASTTTLSALGGVTGGSGGSSGGTLAVGSPVSPASPPFSVIAFDRLVFVAQVDEADIARLEEGMEATVMIDGLPDAELRTSVERIQKTSVLTATGGTAYPVYLRLHGTGEEIFIGMNGSTEIEVSVLEDVVSIPIEALLVDGGDRYVYIVESGRAKRVTVTVGKTTETRAEIASGISAGDAVILSATENLSDGAPVRVR